MGRFSIRPISPGSGSSSHGLTLWEYALLVSCICLVAVCSVKYAGEAGRDKYNILVDETMLQTSAGGDGADGEDPAAGGDFETTPDIPRDIPEQN